MFAPTDTVPWSVMFPTATDRAVETVPVKLMFDVKPLTVRPVIVVMAQSAPAAFNEPTVHAPDPVRALVLALELEKLGVVTVNVCPANVPAVRVSDADELPPMVRLSCNCVVPPAPF